MDEKILANARTEREGETVETIKFSKSVIRMFRELRQRQSREVSEALVEVYEELGIKDRINDQGQTGETVILDPKLTYIEFVTPLKEEPLKDINKEDGG